MKAVCFSGRTAREGKRTGTMWSPNIRAPGRGRSESRGGPRRAGPWARTNGELDCPDREDNEDEEPGPEAAFLETTLSGSSSEKTSAIFQRRL
jgi:hypothetical protein